MPQRFSSIKRDDLPVFESRRASNSSNKSDTAIEESNKEINTKDTIIADLERKRRASNIVTIVQNPEI